MRKKLLLFIVIMLVQTVTVFAAGPDSFSGIYKATKDAVVNISTTKVIKRSYPQMNDEFFKRFFGDDFGNMMPQQPREYKSSALGSGFIIEADGLIVTNNHVIDGADEIIVKLNDEHKFTAKVVGRDPLTDLALIKINPAGVKLQTLPLGDSEKSEIGDWVVAIGNPLGLEWTMTAGIISAKGRSLNSGPYDNFMQTDASINPGNSGGPLINMSGQVVGINTAIIASAQGLGFAIPVNMLKDLLPKLKTGTVKRGWLGVSVQPIDDKLAKGFGLKDSKGALIADVTKDDPAEKAGVKAGDIVVRINGKAIDDSKDLVNMIGAMSPGQNVVLDILRDKKNVRLTVKLGARKDGAEEEGVSGAENKTISVTGLSADELKKLGIPGGVKVKGVDETNNAFQAGVRAGMVIVAVNHEPVKTAGDFNARYNRIQKGAVVILQVFVNGRYNFIAFDKE
ncbi:MAG: Do family serine endopeptidase [Deferribacterales bacterium]